MNGQPNEEAVPITDKLMSNALNFVAKVISNDELDYLDACREQAESSAYYLVAGAHAQVAMLDLLKSALVEEFRGLRKEVSSLARPVGDCGGVAPTDRESKLIFQALMDDYMSRFNILGSIDMIADGELDIDAARRRFMKIAGLE